jgi:hypothetical protein
LLVYWQPAAAGPAATSFVLFVTGGLTGAFPTTNRTLSGTVAPGVYTLSVAGINACGSGAATSALSITVE